MTTAMTVMLWHWPMSTNKEWNRYALVTFLVTKTRSWLHSLIWVIKTSSNAASIVLILKLIQNSKYISPSG